MRNRFFLVEFKCVGCLGLGDIIPMLLHCSPKDVELRKRGEEMGIPGVEGSDDGRSCADCGVVGLPWLCFRD